MIEKTELMIASHLRTNARMTLTELSRKTSVPISTLFDRMHNLHTMGISRMAALLDFASMGFGTCATILLKANSGKRDELRAHLLRALPVNSLMRINNGYDFMAECVFKGMRELEEFCEHLENNYGVRGKEIHFVIEELKREGFLSNPLCVNEVVQNERHN